MRVPRPVEYDDDINNRSTFSLRVRSAIDMVDVPMAYVTRVNDLVENIEKYQGMWDAMTQDEKDDFLSVWRTKFRHELPVQIEKGTDEFAKFQRKAFPIARAAKEFSRDITRHEWLPFADSYRLFRDMYNDVIVLRKQV